MHAKQIDKHFVIQDGQPSNPCIQNTFRHVSKWSNYCSQKCGMPPAFHWNLQSPSSSCSVTSTLHVPGWKCTLLGFWKGHLQSDTIVQCKLVFLPATGTTAACNLCRREQLPPYLALPPHRMTFLHGSKQFLKGWKKIVTMHFVEIVESLQDMFNTTLRSDIF